MPKKYLKGFVKTRHFRERQKQRQVSDAEVKRALETGSLVEGDLGQSFLLDELKVTVDFANGVLITVIPGDPASKRSKVLSKEDARRLRELIELHRLQREEAEEVDEFKAYVQSNKIKKL